MEAAEKAFYEAAMAASTENVSFGRSRDGTELVRIGRVNRPEFASWRYGKRLRARRRRAYAIGVGLGVGGVAIGLGTPGIIAVAAGAAGTIRLLDRLPVMRTADDRLLRRSDAHKALLVPIGAAGWQLAVPGRADGQMVLEGEEALRALRALLPRLNQSDWRSAELENATEEMERIGSPDELIRLASEDLGEAARNFDPRFRTRLFGPKPVSHRIWASNAVIPLALEMAANEEVERRALDGEMAVLEHEWREAEELAGIADDLLFPGALRTRMRTAKIRDSVS